MMSEDVTRDAKNGFPLESHQAPCKCCGQFINIKIQGSRTEADRVELATESCNCEGSKRYTNIKKSSEKIEEVYDDLFKDRDIPDELIDSIKTVTKGVLYGHLIKSKMEIPSRIRDEPKEVLTISEKDGIIKINISQKISRDIKL